MQWFANREQKHLSRILLDIYGAENLEQFRARTLDAVHQVFAGELACHNEIDLSTSESLSALSQPVEDFPELRPAFFEHVEQHPSVQHHLTQEGDVMASEVGKNPRCHIPVL
ncbi:MAG: hypothetical protein HOI95_06220 [Chromatiales bacterium]|jgi:hypothetical protein|nr:hypothetical protein [Chromatiales bacterium]